MAVPQSRSGDSSIFSKASCRYSKHAGLVHTGDGASGSVELASQRGLGERVHDGSPLYLKRAGYQERAGTLACMTF